VSELEGIWPGRLPRRDRCDLLSLEQDAQRISRDVTTLAHVTVDDLILTQSKGARRDLNHDTKTVSDSRIITTHDKRI